MLAVSVARLLPSWVVVLATAALPVCAQQRGGIPLGDGPWTYDTYEKATRIRVSVVTKGISHPWALAFLPNGDILLTEREGRLRIVRNGVLAPDAIQGLSSLKIDKLFDIALHPNFATNKLVYFTYMKAGKRPDGTAGYWATTALGRGRFENGALLNAEDVFVADAWEPFNGGDGSRIVFARDGKIFFASSHRQSVTGPQDVNSDIGKIFRLNDDGSIPEDNPFVGLAGRKPEIYSYGHRTILGLTIHPQTGQLWETENGPQGGDEVNIIRPGLNYGWPVVTYGRDYNGKKASDRPWRDDMEAPEIFWVPSITASGIAFYNGDQIPAWKGNLFVGSMTVGRLPNTGHLQRIVFNEDGEQRREMLLTDLKQRIRDVRQGPDGFLYLITDENAGALLKIEPLN
jgi:aldose sugar dehydrogenase